VPLLNSIQQYPMQFMMPSFSPALTANPEIAKAAQYGGGGSGGGGGTIPASGAGTAPGGTAPSSGSLPESSGGGSGIMAQIMKLLGGSCGGGTDAIMSLLAGL
jgi:hypothetical protein